MVHIHIKKMLNIYKNSNKNNNNIISLLCMDYNSIVYMYNIHCISMSHGLVITQYAIHVL